MLLLSLLNRAWWRVSMLRGERLGYLQLICILHLIYIFNKKNAAMRCGLKVCVWFPTQPIPCMRSLHVLTCLLVELGVELLFWMERIIVLMLREHYPTLLLSITFLSRVLHSLNLLLSFSSVPLSQLSLHVPLFLSFLSQILSIFLSSLKFPPSPLSPFIFKSLHLSLLLYLNLSTSFYLSLIFSISPSPSL